MREKWNWSVSLQDEESVLKLSVMFAQLCEQTEVWWIINYMILELYLNLTVFFFNMKQTNT